MLLPVCWRPVGCGKKKSVFGVSRVFSPDSGRIFRIFINLCDVCWLRLLLIGCMCTYSTKGARPRERHTDTNLRHLAFSPTERGWKSCRRLKHGLWRSRGDAERSCCDMSFVGVVLLDESVQSCFRVVVVTDISYLID